MPRPFYVTTPIYYVNDKPHIGHAYTTLAADTLARFHRLAGRPVWFLTGTDEHGQKIERAAKDAGISPMEHADKYAERFRGLWPLLGVQNDDFIRTTEPRHKAVVEEMWRRMEAAGDIYLGKYEGWYSFGDEAYFTEEELVDGKAPTGHEVSWVVEPSYFFRLSRYGSRLLEHLDKHPEFIRPASRLNEIARFVEGGLQDISVSRTSFSWGVPVPGADGHVIYVWVDALTNYISALGGPGTPEFQKFWPRALHIIGKDILRFHAVYWPCFLMSAGLPLPHQIYAHGWWTHDGEKMSKTRGNAIDPVAMVERYGADAFRYFLLREVSFGLDGDFSERALRDRINGDLANDYGNLLQRSLTMLQKYHQGVVPERGEAAEEDETLRGAFAQAHGELYGAMDDLAFHKALGAIWTLVRAANKYVDTTAPWALAKKGRTERLHEVLYTLCETLRIIGVWTQPFLPERARVMLDRLGVPESLRTLATTAEWGQLPPGTRTGEGPALFPRLEPLPEPPGEAPDEAPALPATPRVQYEDFARLQLVAARIVAAERHPDADRLLVLTVDAGEPAPRTVCAGIASAYAPEDLVGQMVVLVANLEPRKIRGVRSEGMVLAAGNGAEVRLLTVPGEPKPGTPVS